MIEKMRYFYDRIFIWRYHILRRFIVERIYSIYIIFNYKVESLKSKNLIYMVGMPRTGSSFLKNYFGHFQGIEVMKFQPKGFHRTYTYALSKHDRIMLDKSTHYIRILNFMCKILGQRAAYVCIVRDPRDQLVSLWDFERHHELPRNEKFWLKWHDQYANMLKCMTKFSKIDFFLCRYEDVVNDPVSAKFEFIKWTGSNCSINDIDDALTIKHRDDIQDDKLLRTQGASPNSVGKYRSVQGIEMLSVLNYYRTNDKIMRLMKVFGYAENGLDNCMHLEHRKNVSVFER
jgi:hypothetical protein